MHHSMKLASALFAALFVTIAVGGDDRSDWSVTRSTLSGGVGGYPSIVSCESLSSTAAAELLAISPAGPFQAAGSPVRAATAQAREVPSEAPRLELPTHIGNVPEWARTPWISDAIPGEIVPADYVHPHQRIVESGHLQVDRTIEIARIPGRSRFVNVQSLDVPTWARQVLIEFVPDPDNGSMAGMWVRPDRAFDTVDIPRLSSAFQVPDDFVAETQAIGFAQATHWALSSLATSGWAGDGPTNGGPLSIWLHPDSDPAPAGRSLHIALSHVWSPGPYDDNPIRGRLRVWFSSSREMPPPAYQFFFSTEEYQARVGYFSDEPREITGDNPGETLGEALRWILYRSTQELLDELDLGDTGYLPVPVYVYTLRTEDMGGGSGFAGGGWSVPAPRLWPLPDRWRGEPVNETDSYWREVNPVARLPLERSAGTSLCQLPGFISTRPVALSGCRQEAQRSLLNRRSGSSGLVIILRPTNDAGVTPDGRGWDLNWSETVGPPVSWILRHEMLHVMGINSRSLNNRTYVHTMEPPRAYRDRPRPANGGLITEEDGIWRGTGDRASFLGPNTVTSPYNPWAGTMHPGIRLNDANGDFGHLLRAPGDEWAQWSDAPEAGGVMRAQFDSSFNAGPARPILLDLGYDLSQGFFQDRRLPRHLYDPERNGHGIDFRRIVYPDGQMVHLMHFYTFDAEGNPTWYMAVGQVDEQGVFEANLDYFTYDADRVPPQRIDPNRGGRIRLDFYPSVNHPACGPRFDPDYATGTLRTIHVGMDWELDGETGTWCLQPLQMGDLPAFPVDVSGTWAASDPADIGWGLSVVNRQYGPRPFIITVLYYYDAEGNPTWAWGETGGQAQLPPGSIQSSATVNLLHFDGYCRGCQPFLQTRPAGEMRLRLGSPDNSQPGRNWIESLELTNHGPGGGTWNRSDIGVYQLSSPMPNMRR